ncbi:YchJ family protein [Verrucosispora sp. WMMD703]|uniref:YchJ family protein n=1 Tax=unclassified Micromonospora TaxID=2617518 RepID=UPI00249C5542|nr:YchJ family protein [Verrucosispora sp. WMMD1129]WFE42816.1 YchJ family protein [Verrucosispora sp. WMMD1129]
MAKRDRRPASGPEVTGTCPCGQGLPYADCCGRLHRGEADAPTAEALMRSRYAAFAVGDPDYLLRSWHSGTRPPRLHLDPAQRWTGLEVLDTDGGGLFDSTGTVEFRAHYREGRDPGTVTERSRFVREDGRWVYLDDDLG